MKNVFGRARPGLAPVLALLTACVGTGMDPKASSATRPLVSAGWTATEGMDSPESAYLDPESGFLFVSQVTGELEGRDGTGRIASRITLRVKIEGARFLNDVACGPDGRVFVSDMLASRIFAVTGGVASVLVEGEDIEYPNGLLVEGDRLVVGG